MLFRSIALIQIAVTAFLIKYFGLAGAVWASFITKVVQVVFLYLESKKVFYFKFNYVKQIYLPVICSIVVILLETLIPAEYVLVNRAMQLVIVYVLVFAVYRRDIRLLPVVGKFFGKE